MRRVQRPLGVLTIAVVVSVISIAGFQFTHRHDQADLLLVNGHTYSLEIADTQASRELGLGNRNALPTNQGMLFVFQNVAPECFWMKDMHFPLDMIWVSSHKKVVHIEHDVSPSTYPNSFCPEAPVKYVIELNAGTSATANINEGDTLDF